MNTDLMELESSPIEARAHSQQPVQQQVDMLTEKFQPQLQTLMLISIVLIILMVVVTLINTVYKWRVERAILRMDKNLKRLVDTAQPISLEQANDSKSLVKNDIEQN